MTNSWWIRITCGTFIKTIFIGKNLFYYYYYYYWRNNKKKLKRNKLTFGEIQDKQLEFDGPSHVSHPVSHAITNFWRKKKEEKKIIKIWNWDKEIMKLIKNNETKKQRKEKNFTLTKIRWIDENWKRFWRTWSNTFFCLWNIILISFTC